MLVRPLPYVVYRSIVVVGVVHIIIEQVFGLSTNWDTIIDGEGGITCLLCELPYGSQLKRSGPRSQANQMKKTWFAQAVGQ